MQAVTQWCAGPFRLVGNGIMAIAAGDIDGIFGGAVSKAMRALETVAACGVMADDYDIEQADHRLAPFLEQVAELDDPLKVAVSCRLPTEIRRLLRGCAVDVTWSRRAELMAMCTEPSLWGVPAADLDAAVAAETRRLAKAVAMPWASKRHALYHGGVRAAVRTVMLAAQRLQATMREDGNPLPAVGVPLEMWLHILSFVRRADFAPR